jgi:N-acyl-phosphatidylethanolamine-hydrolysing phospholipase D
MKKPPSTSKIMFIKKGGMLRLGFIGVLTLGCLHQASLAVSPTALPGRAEHHSADGFRNRHVSGAAKGLWDVLRWQLSKEARPIDKGTVERVPIDFSAINHGDGSSRLTWIGHSTVLIQSSGINILSDPILSERASPVSFAGPKRYTPPALQLHELPDIDFVVISHNHYDHLDRSTVEALGNSVQWLVPLGLASWFHELGIERVRELDWWEELRFGKVTFVATPSQHWSSRGLFDKNETLWASWVIMVGDERYWFGGDTGYNPHDFNEIGQRYGPFDLAVIPIGAYEPRWFMKQMHVNPQEAVKIHQDIRSMFSVPVHWGTFKLSDEAILAPARDLRAARKTFDIEEKYFPILRLGETRKIKL